MIGNCYPLPIALVNSFFFLIYMPTAIVPFNTGCPLIWTDSALKIRSLSTSFIHFFYSRFFLNRNTLKKLIKAQSNRFGKKIQQCEPFTKSFKYYQISCSTNVYPKTQSPKNRKKVHWSGKKSLPTKNKAIIIVCFAL